MALVVAGLMVAGVAMDAAMKPLRPSVDPVAQAQDERRFKAARVAHAAIMKALNDPSSASWDSLLTNESGTVVCAEVRARNGFNGMARGYFTVMSGLVSTNHETWNRYCAKAKLYNLTDFAGYL